LFAALSSNRLGGAALDVWWQHWDPAHPDRRPSRSPFQELPNVIMTPHCSGFTKGTAERRWVELPKTSTDSCAATRSPMLSR